MRFESPLLTGTFLKRYKRFFADVKLPDGQIVVAHVPNSGSMKGCNDPGMPCLISHNPAPNRKLHYTLEMVRARSTWIGVNTGLSNKLVWELWQSRRNKSWRKFDRGQREVKIHEASRLDLVLWKSSTGFKEDKLQKMNFKLTPHQFHFVEVKNVSLADGSTAIFPDSVTERGQKHLLDLMNLIKLGHTAEILFTIQREDTKSFSPADAIDPEYGKLLRKAIKAGVIITPLVCRISPTGLEIDPEPLPLNFD